MIEVKAIIRPERLDHVLHALHAVAGTPGVTVSEVEGFGRERPPRGEGGFGRVRMAKVETVVPRELVPAVVVAIYSAGTTGRAGDGKIFLLPVVSAVNLRDGIAEPPLDRLPL